MRNFFFMILCLFASVETADAFNIPERLEYDLTWGGIKAGTAALEVRKDEDGIRIISTAGSVKWVSAIYHVDDRVESRVADLSAMGRDSLANLVPLNYRVRLKEGRHKRDKEVVFMHKDKKALYIDHLSSDRQEFDIVERIFDPLSGFYHIRNMELKVGKPLYIPIFDSKRIWEVEVQVLRKEKLNLPSGTFNAIVIKPLMKSEGIFSRTGEMYIWLTDDEKKIPVQLKSKVTVGYVTATLTGGKY